jgi:methylmalonyl-CoA mutase N-terminal domain/subunit
VQREIADAAYLCQQEIENGEQFVVGVNRFVTEEDVIALERLVVDPSIEEQQRQRLAELRARRDNERVGALLAQIESAARANENLMPLFIAAVENDVTLGEICNLLRDVWGEYRPVMRI